MVWLLVVRYGGVMGCGCWYFRVVLRFGGVWLLVVRCEGVVLCVSGVNNSMKFMKKK